MPRIALLYTTFSKKTHARRALRALMKERLVACGVLSEATSTYFWRGKMPSEQEVVLVMKTSQRRARLARVALEKMHPYEVPCILSWSADANTSYAQWIDTETR